MRCAVFALLLAICTPCLADKEKIQHEIIPFNIPQQRADTALIQFAEQANLTLIVPFEEVRGKMANRLVGRYSKEVAVRLLLAGTGLHAVIGDEGQLSISGMPLGGESNMHKRSKLSLGILAALGSYFGAQASNAQTETASQQFVEEVVVTGVRASLSKALDMKRNSDNFEDALVAEDIGKFPDLNLAEALQRIPGVTVNRTEGGDQSSAVGEAASINLRGLDSDFTAVTINGTKAVTPGRERGFSFNQLASELFSGAVVSKSLTAKDDEGGLAGTVKLSTYKPLEHSEKILNIGVQGVYGDLTESVEPKFTALYVDQLNDGKVGVTLGLVYSDTEKVEYGADTSVWVPLEFSLGNIEDRIANGDFTQEQFDSISGENILFIPRDPRNLANRRQNERINTTFTLQAELSDSVVLTLDGIYAGTDQTGEQIRNDYPIEGFPPTGIPADLARDGERFVSGTFPESSQFMRVLGYDYGVDTSLYQLNVSADIQLTDSLSLNALVGTTSAEEDFYSWTDIDIRSANTAIFYEVLGDFVNFTAQTDGITVGDVNSYTVLQQIRARPTLDEDDQDTVKLDFSYQADGSLFQSIDFGLSYSARTKGFSSFEDRRRSSSAELMAFTGNIADYLVVNDFEVGGAPAAYPGDIISIEYDRLVDDVLGGNPLSPSLKATASYEVDEDILAAYVMTDFVVGESVSGNIGVRYVSTDQASSGTASSDEGEFPVSLDSSYNELLPSLNLKWNATDELVVRAAVYKSLTRPNLSAIAPAISVNFGTGTGRAGNPDIDPFTATNYDLGVEWYFAEDSAFTVAYFRKDLNGLIENATIDQQIENSDGVPQTVSVTSPINGESAEVSGWELGFTTPFGFFPEAGIAVNATFTDSSAEFVSETDANDLIASQLEGLSDTSYNAILYYDNQIVSAKLAYNWRSDYLAVASSSKGQPRYRDEYGQLDFSAGYAVNDNIDVRLDILNITDEQLRSYTHDDKLRIKGLLETGTTFQLGINYSF